MGVSRVCGEFGIYGTKYRIRHRQVSDPPTGLPMELQEHRHRLPLGPSVGSPPILGGLHDEYAFQQTA